MEQRESDPTGAFSGGGAAGLDPTGPDDEGRDSENGTMPPDSEERDLVVSGKAATSEIADPEAQANAEAQGDGPPLPR